MTLPHAVAHHACMVQLSRATTTACWSCLYGRAPAGHQEAGFCFFLPCWPTTLIVCVAHHHRIARTFAATSGCQVGSVHLKVLAAHKADITANIKVLVSQPIGVATPAMVAQINLSQQHSDEHMRRRQPC